MTFSQFLYSLLKYYQSFIIHTHRSFFRSPVITTVLVISNRLTTNYSYTLPSFSVFNSIQFVVLLSSCTCIKYYVFSNILSFSVSSPSLYLILYSFSLTFWFCLAVYCDSILHNKFPSVSIYVFFFSLLDSFTVHKRFYTQGFLWRARGSDLGAIQATHNILSFMFLTNSLYNNLATKFRFEFRVTNSQQLERQVERKRWTNRLV